LVAYRSGFLELLNFAARARSGPALFGRRHDALAVLDLLVGWVVVVVGRVVERIFQELSPVITNDPDSAVSIWMDHNPAVGSEAVLTALGFFSAVFCGPEALDTAILAN